MFILKKQDRGAMKTQGWRVGIKTDCETS